jgi:hypothetical protein
MTGRFAQWGSLVQTRRREARVCVPVGKIEWLWIDHFSKDFP